MNVIMEYIAERGGAIFVFSQLLSVIATCLLLLSFQQKTHRRIIVMQAFSGFLFGTQYLMIGASEGMICNYLGMLRSITYSFRGKSKAVDCIACPIFFSALFIISSIFTYQSPVSLLPPVAMVISSFVLWSPKTQKLRALSLPTSLFWLVYNASSGAIVPVITEVLNSLSILIALFRFSKFNKKRKDNQ